MANEISSIKLPSGTVYEIKDATARNMLSGISGAMHFAGITTTGLTDGSTTRSVTIDSASYSANAGDVVIYDEKEYVWSGSKWHEFGSTGSLKALAFKSSVTVKYKKAKKSGSVTWAGKSTTFSGSNTATGNVTISKGTVATATPANYTPEGSITNTAMTTTVTLKNATVKQVKSVGSMTNISTAPSFTATMNSTSTEQLDLGWTAMVYTNGSVPQSENVTVGVDSATTTFNNTPGFSGTAARLNATFSGTAFDVSVSGTPLGTLTDGTSISYDDADATVTLVD